MRTRHILIGVTTLLLFVSLACSASLGRSDEAPTDGGASLSERAENVAAQAAAAATAAAEAAASIAVPTVSLPTDSSAAATAAAQALDDLQPATGDLQATAVAAATTVVDAAGNLTLPDIDGATLAERFNALRFDENGSYTITLTEAELNEAIRRGQEQNGNAGGMEETAVQFSDGLIILTGNVTTPNLGTLTVQMRPIVDDGTLQFEVVSATVGNVTVPAPLLQTAENTLNGTLGAALNNLPAGVTLQSVTISDGTMTLILIKV